MEYSIPYFTEHLYIHVTNICLKRAGSFSLLVNSVYNLSLYIKGRFPWVFLYTALTVHEIGHAMHAINH